MFKLGGINGARAVFSTSGFRFVVQFTSSATNSICSDFMVDYLVKSLGFSKDEAIVTSSKISRFSSPEKPDSVVHFLKQIGLEDTQIRKVVFSVPKILSCGIDKNLRPKMAVFQDLGLSGSDLADIISMHPGICRRGLNHIVSTLDALKSVADDNISLARALKVSQWMLATGVAKKLPLNVALLQKYGLSADKIGTLLSRNPRFFIRDPECLQAALIKVEERFQICRNSPMFYHAIYAFCVPEETMESKIEIYKSFGWTDSDVLTLARKNPYALTYSDSKITKALSFYMRQLGYQPAEIASCPFMLSLSLEKRVIPRYEVLRVLKEKGLVKISYSLSSCLVVTESKFLKRFVLPVKEEVPKLYKEYRKKVRSHLKAVD